MPPVVFLALIGAAGIAGYKLLSALVRPAPARKEAQHLRRATAAERDLGNLEWDEAAGVYRPRSKRES